MTRDFSQEEREQWKNDKIKKREELTKLITDTAQSYEANPEHLAEFFSFSSRFYRYSPKNNMLICSQNPHATFVQSYTAWKRAGVNVKGGEKGIGILRPVEVKLIEVEEEKWIEIGLASEEDKIRHRAGEIEERKIIAFNQAYVFDISQTNYPIEDYPKLMSMGYPSTAHDDITKGLIDYAKDNLDCKVSIESMSSASLKGSFIPSYNEIKINELLGSTERLSVMSHELGHALLHKKTDSLKSLSQIEFEADALSIMIDGKLGLELTEGRKSHLADHFNKLKAELGDDMASIDNIISSVYETFKSAIPDIEKAIEQRVVTVDKAVGANTENLAQKKMEGGEIKSEPIKPEGLKNKALTDLPSQRTPQKSTPSRRMRL